MKRESYIPSGFVSMFSNLFLFSSIQMKRKSNGKWSLTGENGRAGILDRERGGSPTEKCSFTSWIFFVHFWTCPYSTRKQQKRGELEIGEKKGGQTQVGRRKESAGGSDVNACTRPYTTTSQNRKGVAGKIHTVVAVLYPKVDLHYGLAPTDGTYFCFLQSLTHPHHLAGWLPCLLWVWLDCWTFFGLGEVY